MFYVQFTRIDYEDYCWTDMPILFKTEKDAEKYLNKEIFRRMNVIFRYYVDNPNIINIHDRILFDNNDQYIKIKDKYADNYDVLIKLHKKYINKDIGNSFDWAFEEIEFTS